MVSKDIPLIAILKESVDFDFYRDGVLYYVTYSGFRFTVPIAEVGTGTCLKHDKAMTFMRWLRPQYNEFLQSVSLDGRATA
jgi:hypothetical protein